MIENDAINYRSYLFKMTDDELDAETKEAVRQRNSMMIQFCYNDWRRRGQGARFLKSYNKTIEPDTVIDFEFR
jgi:hypothetical protein